MGLTGISEITGIIISGLLPTSTVIPTVTVKDLLPKATDAFNSILTNRNNLLWNNTYNPSGKLNSIDYRQYLQIGNYQIKKVADTIVSPADSNDEKAEKILAWVQKNFTYVSDGTQYHFSEYWAKPTESLISMSGDCVAEYEEIYTKKGLKTAKKLKVGDLVLSYDFDKCAFVYKPIIKKWNKGVKEVVRVLFRNGQCIDVTLDHNFIVRDTYKRKNYIKKKLKDIDLTRWWKRKVPICVKIPYKQSKPKFKKELYRVIGHYIAEGWYSGKVGSSGYDLKDNIIPILKKFKIPFSEGMNGTNVPMVNFLKSEFKEYLKGLKRNSFDITLYEDIINLPPDYLEEFLYGLWLGDGTKDQYSDKRGYANNKEWTFSTSSKQLADDLQRIGLHLGRTFHIWRQEVHKGAGKKPIYRINYNSNSFYLRNHGYQDLSEVSIRSIEKIGCVQTYDWEIKDTHNFVFKNGIITHNCEDGSFLIHSLLLAAGVPADRVRTYAGLVESGVNAPYGGHAWTVYRRETDGAWVDLDWCFYPDDTPISKRETFSAQDEYADAYWWMNAYGTYDEYGKWGIDIYA